MLRTMWVVTMALALAACANHGKLRQRELARMGDWLPGSYDNSAQVDEDLRQGVAPVHPAIEIIIIPIAAPFIGELVVYVEQADLMSGRRVTSQQLYRFDKSPDEKVVVQRIFEFKEPTRWIGGHRRADIFKGLVLDDMTATAACDLKWSVEGEFFVGTAGRKGCPIRRMSFDGLELNIEPAGRPDGDMLRLRRIGAE